MTQSSNYLTVRIAIPDIPDVCDSIDQHLYELIRLLGPSQLLFWYEEQNNASSDREPSASVLLHLIHQQYSSGMVDLPSTVRYFRRIRSLVESKACAVELELLIRDILDPHSVCLLPSETEHWSQNAVSSRALNIIDSQYHHLSLDGIATQLGINSSYLSRVLAQNTGCSFPELLHTRRILAFVALCMQEMSASDSIDDAVFRVGYTSIHHFWRVFKRYTGLSPSAVRRNLKSDGFDKSGLFAKKSHIAR